MEGLKFYEVDPSYVNSLIPYAPHLFHNRKAGQANERKYIGIVLQINGFSYFAPLSSFKPKHKNMKESLDLLKVGDYAVINLNNMFPVPESKYQYVDFNKIKDRSYRALLLSEYRIVKAMQGKIRRNAAILYEHKKRNREQTALARRCNNFMLLEEVCKEMWR